MAWVRMRESGQYQGCYRNANGETRSAGTFTQRRQALTAALKMEEEQQHHGAVDPQDGRIRWSDWFEKWHGARTLAYATDSIYRCTADLHIKPVWGNTRLVDITELELEAWVTRMQHGRHRRSVWIVRNALVLMKASLNAAVRDRRLSYSAARHVPLPDMPVGGERFLTPDEVEAVCFALDGIDALIVWTLVQTGLRFGELAGLHWHRLDLENGRLRVVEKFDQKALRIDPLPKDDEERTLPLPDDLVELFVRYRDHAAPERRETCGVEHVAGRCGGDLVFRGRRGSPLKSNDWGRWAWRRGLRLAGIEGRVRPHDLRHTYASWLLQEGVHLAELARMLGHSDWETTKRYAHLSEQGFDTVREALRAHRRSAGRAGGRAAERAAERRYSPLSDATGEAADDAV